MTLKFNLAPLAMFFYALGDIVHREFDVFSKNHFDVSVWHNRSTIKTFVVASVIIAIIVLIVEAFKFVFKKNEKVLKLARYI